MKSNAARMVATAGFGLAFVFCSVSVVALAADGIAATDRFLGALTVMLMSDMQMP